MTIPFHCQSPRNGQTALAFLGAFLLSSSSALEAQDWPRLRGEDGSNVSKEKGWSSVGSEQPLWKADIGRGYSSPSLAEGRLYIAGYFDGVEGPTVGLDRVQCLDAATGELLWSAEYPSLAYANEHAGGALSTPTVADGVVVVPSRGGEVRAFDAVSGEIKWKIDLVERHAVSPGRYGFASSPFVLGDGLVLNAGRTVMLERSTGETLWISDDYKANFSSVAPIELGEVLGLVVFGEVGLVVIDAATGEHIQTFVFRKTPRNVEGAMPIVMGTKVFISSAYDQGGVLVDFAGGEPELLWRTRRMRSKMDGCTLYQDHLYGFDESMLKCMDLNGEELWRERGLGHGALTVSDGRLLITTSRGELVVAKATPDAFEELSRRSVLSDGVFWTSPILANGLVYFRGSRGELVCLDHRADSALGVAASGTGPIPGPRELPSVEELAQRHLEASGLAAKPIEHLRLTGRLHNDALGLADRPASWAIGSGGRWHSKFDLPPAYGGSIEQVFDGQRGWSVDPFRGDSLFEERQLAELRATQGYQLLLNPLQDGEAALTLGLEKFRGVLCYRVDVALDEDASRRVYFNAKSGLLVGRTADSEDTIVLGGWREFEGRTLPMERTVFNAETGEEQRWIFSEASLETLDAELFDFPPGLEEEQEEEDG